MRVDAVIIKDLEMICKLMAETNVEARATLVLEAKEKRIRCIGKHEEKQVERMAVAFDVSQMGRQTNAIESVNGSASKAERRYFIGEDNALDGCPTNV